MGGNGRDHDTLMLLNGANPVHVDFGKTVGADQFTIKEKVSKGQFAPLKAVRLVKNAISLPNGYRTVLCESCYYYPAIKKRFFGLRSRIVNINCGPLIYNLWSGRIRGIGGMERKFLISLLNEVDGHLVFGEYGVELLERLGQSNKPIQKVYPFIADDRYEKLLEIKPQLDSKEITIIGNDDISCKGIDLAVDAFNKALESDNELRLNIVGNIEREKLEALDTGKISPGSIKYLGMIGDVIQTLRNTGLYLHPSRGDTFPRASLEAMAAGIPTIVSKETGTKELVGEVDDKMVCELDGEDIARRINDYFGLPMAAKERLSAGFRTSAKRFNRKEQLKNFKEQFRNLSSSSPVSEDGK